MFQPLQSDDPSQVAGYRLAARLGAGGMGRVYLSHTQGGRPVAIKVVRPELADDPAFRRRFGREIKAARRVRGAYTAELIDADADGVPPWLATLYVPGPSLAEAVGRRGPLPVPAVLWLMAGVAEALQAIHDEGIVHRDLKPANIMLLTDGTVKICDFGIARLGRDVTFTSRLTGTGIAMGTPHYMSPEQISGGEVDQRSDLYSFGCVLYEIVTGVPPFDLDDAWAVLMGHRDTAPTPPRRHRAEIPDYLDRIILDLLAKEPEERPHDAREVGRRVAEGRAATVMAPGRAPVPTAVSRPALPEAAPGPRMRPEQPPSREPRLPSWTRGMTTGHKATGTGRGGLTPPDASAGLTGEWIARPATGRAEEPVRTERPTPSPELITTLTGRHNAGLSLGRLGRWTEAGEVHRAVAAEREHALGPDHPDTLASRYEVGFTLSRTGRPADALREFAHVARVREHVLGPDHPDTLASRQEMAYVLGQLGRHFEAHQAYTSVLASREHLAGPDHPDTLRCRHNLAFNLSRLGRLEDSYRMASEVAAARARVLGANHPDTLVTRYEVGYALGQLGRWPEALEAYREVAETRAQALGPDHPDTLAARHEVGISLGRLGRSTDALTLYRALVDDRTRVHGPADTETLRARHGLGVNLGRLGRWEEALAESRDVSTLRERVLGPDHPDTLVSRREVAVGLGWLGRWADALTEYRRVADAREHVLGPAHPDALTSRNDEAHCLEQLGRGQEAAELYRWVAALRQSRTTDTP
ncbi:serine/threonine-protein kinase [Streptomyces griseiscabiei]|uniref:serine/threonine-protein kinase n=1 Tax=Streptomyces griseiscabiei TaxID=2993540 RepID=UPI003873066F